jgi:Uma2 family endonuclease
MNTALETEFLSVNDYLAGEEQGEARHEYLAGMVYAMAGGSDAHNTIALSFAANLRTHLRGSPCRVFMADVKARLFVAERDVFYYPDVMVACDARDSDPYFKRYPKVLVEVLSETTENIDRREKFWNYTQVASLEAYVLAAQDKMEVTIFRRSEGWRPEILKSADQELDLPSLKLKLPLRAIYEGVEFKP